MDKSQTFAYQDPTTSIQSSFQKSIEGMSSRLQYVADGPADAMLYPRELPLTYPMSTWGGMHKLWASSLMDGLNVKIGVAEVIVTVYELMSLL